MIMKARKRVSKDEWLTQALEVLSTEGVQGVRIERLARDLNISKSGFYWHFKDRQDLLKQLLDYWAHEFTQVLTHNRALSDASPAVRIEQVMRMIREHKLAKYDLTMRGWAEFDAQAAEVVAKVYQQRLDLVFEAFKNCGFEGDELKMRARLFVCYHTWETAMFGEELEEDTDRLLKLRHKLLTEKR